MCEGGASGIGDNRRRACTLRGDLYVGRTYFVAVGTESPVAFSVLPYPGGGRRGEAQLLRLAFSGAIGAAWEDEEDAEEASEALDDEEAMRAVDEAAASLNRALNAADVPRVVQLIGGQTAGELRRVRSRYRAFFQRDLARDVREVGRCGRLCALMTLSREEVDARYLHSQLTFKHGAGEFFSAAVSEAAAAAASSSSAVKAKRAWRRAAGSGTKKADWSGILEVLCTSSPASSSRCASATPRRTPKITPSRRHWRGTLTQMARRTAITTTSSSQHCRCFRRSSKVAKRPRAGHSHIWWPATSACCVWLSHRRGRWAWRPLGGGRRRRRNVRRRTRRRLSTSSRLRASGARVTCICSASKPPTRSARSLVGDWMPS